MYVSEGITDKSTLTRLMAWCQTDDESLFEPKMTKIYDYIWHHSNEFQVGLPAGTALDEPTAKVSSCMR